MKLRNDTALQLVRITKRVSILTAVGALAFSGGYSVAFGQQIDDEDAIEVIIVTAQRREQNILEVPLAITAIGQDVIEAAGINRMADFYRRVPSVAVIDQGAARKNVIIRGIQTSTSTESSVTDVYLDDQRITSAIATGDPRTFDLMDLRITVETSFSSGRPSTCLSTACKSR